MGVMIRRWRSNRPPLADHKPLPYLPPSSQHERKVPKHHAATDLHQPPGRAGRVRAGRAVPAAQRAGGGGVRQRADAHRGRRARRGAASVAAARGAGDHRGHPDSGGDAAGALRKPRGAVPRALARSGGGRREPRAPRVRKRPRRVVDVGGPAGRAGLDGARRGRAHGRERAVSVRKPVSLRQRAAGGGVSPDQRGLSAARAGFRSGLGRRCFRCA